MILKTWKLKAAVFGVAAIIVLGILAAGGWFFLNHSEPNMSATHNIETALLELKERQFPIPLLRDGGGGSVSHFKNEIVVLTNDGRVFALDGNNLVKSPMAVPDNGIAQLELAAKTEKYKDYRIVFDPIRYNDLIFYEDAGATGAVISYTFWDDEHECFGTAVAQLPIDPSASLISAFSVRPSDWHVIYKTSPCLLPKKIAVAIGGRRAGGRLLYEAGGKVILASGDYEMDGVEGPERLAQGDDNDYGKIIEIDLRTGEARHIAKGLRNPQGITADLNGGIWITEQGPRGGDELNHVRQDANFGWPEVTLGTRYNRLPWPGNGIYGRHDGYDAPVFAWVPSVATSSITTLQGMHPAWDGDLMVGSLSARTLYRIRLEGDRVLYAEDIALNTRIRSVHQAPGGRLAVWGDDSILRILTVTELGAGEKFLNEVISKLKTSNEKKAEIRAVFTRCAECHAFDYGQAGQAPSLGSVFNATIGRSSFPNYSAALSGHGGNWTRENLVSYLTSVQKFAPGSAMPDPGIGDPELVDQVVDVLDQLTRYRSTK